jgi:DNA-binding transcriptional ArsR family regulator
VSAAEQIVEQLTAAEAEQLLDTVTRQAEALDTTLGRLYHGGAAEALGFGAGAKGWTALCRAHLAHLEWLHIKPGPQRLEKVQRLREQQLSTRAIGDAMGLSAATVSGELRKLRDAGVDLPDNVVSLDNRRRPAAAAERPVAAPRVMPEPPPLSELMRTALEAVWLAGESGLTLYELADGQRWREGRCTSLLNRLERAGLVRRTEGRRGTCRPYVATFPD